MHKKIFRSAKMRSMQRGVMPNTYGSTSIAIASSPRPLPALYAVSGLKYYMDNKNIYHPFCFGARGFPFGNFSTEPLRTSSFSSGIIFNENPNDYPGQNRYTGYFTGFYGFVPITYIKDIGYNSVLPNSDFVNTTNLNGFIYLFRFFDSTQCGCNLANSAGSDTYVRCNPEISKPGVIIFVTRVSEINTISSNKNSAETFNMTRPLSNAILDYCEKNNTTPKQIFTNAAAAILPSSVEKIKDFFDEELIRYNW